MEFHHLEKVSTVLLLLPAPFIFLLLILVFIIPGDGVPRGSGVQSRPWRLSARPRKTMDHIFKSKA